VDLIRLTRAPLSVGSAYARLAVAGAGGVTVFIGRVRDDAVDGGQVAALFYEAHAPVALAELRALSARARRRFHLTEVLLWHRLGDLPVGTASVVVGAAAVHRAASFAGARYLIEELKRSVPIWKTDRVRRARPRRRSPRRPRGRSSG
jgi:molybdopterin synthase catalytic subunit